MEEEKTESYRALYRVRPLIYHIGDIRLWVPIRQDGIVLWLVYVVLFFIFCYVIPILAWILPLDRSVVMLVGPIVAAYYSVKLDPAGKTVPRFLLDLLQFLVRPKWMIRFQFIRFSGGKRKISFWGRCRRYTLRKTKQGMEEWRGQRESIQGRVQGLFYLKLPANFRVLWHDRFKRLTMSEANASESNAESNLLQALAKKKIQYVTNDSVEVHVSSAGTSQSWKVTSIK